MGIIHVVLGVLGTFVLKRFPTSFSVGFFLGCTAIVANQNLIQSITFRGYGYGKTSTNVIFANLGFCIFLVLAFFTLILFHFKEHIVVAPIDAKGMGSSGRSSPRKHANDVSTSDYDEMS